MGAESEQIFSDPKYRYWDDLELKLREMKDRFTVISEESFQPPLTTPIKLGDQSVTDPDFLVLMPIVCLDCIRTMQNPKDSENDRKKALRYINGEEALDPGAMFNWANIVVGREIDGIIESYRKKG